jgi:anti-sigma-K factor RskA
MERAEIHELTAAYAVDALDVAELATFEQHLAHCQECRDQVAGFQAAAAELAYETEAPAPSPALRARILAEAGRERPKVVALAPRRRWAFPVAAAAAVAAGCAAVGLAFWAADLSQEVDDLQAQQHRSEEVAIMLANPNAERVPLEGANGVLVVDGETQMGHLLVFGLEEAPAAQTYEAWVIEDGQAVQAGLFSGGAGSTTVVPLTEPVPEGAIVAVTVEQAGGVEQSEQQPIIVSGQAA